MWEGRATRKESRDQQSRQRGGAQQRAAPRERGEGGSGTRGGGALLHRQRGEGGGARSLRGASPLVRAQSEEGARARPRAQRERTGGLRSQQRRGARRAQKGTAWQSLRRGERTKGRGGRPRGLPKRRASEEAEASGSLEQSRAGGLRQRSGALAGLLEALYQ